MKFLKPSFLKILFLSL
jgi:hypothetical protein